VSPFTGWEGLPIHVPYAVSLPCPRVLRVFRDDPPSPSSKGPLQRTGSLTKSVPKNYVINLFFARLQRLTIEKLSSLVSKINFTPRLRGINVMLGRAWSRLRSALSKTDEVAAVSEPGPGAFGIGIKKQTYLYEPLAEHGNLDLEIDLYFRNPHLEMIKNFKYSFASRGIKNHMKQELQRVFGDFGLTLQSQAKAEKSLQPEIEQLGTFLQKSLTNKYDSSSDAMKNLAERLSAYKSERLLKDQESKGVLFLNYFYACIRQVKILMIPDML
jgi:hypothetical protein